MSTRAERLTKVKSIFSSSIFWVAFIGGTVQLSKVATEVILDGQPLNSSRANNMIETIGTSLLVIICRVNGGGPVYTPKGIFGPNYEDYLANNLAAATITTERSNLALSVPVSTTIDPQATEDNHKVATVAIETVRTTADTDVMVEPVRTEEESPMEKRAAMIERS